MTTRSVVSATVGAGAATTTTRATTTTAATLRRRLMSFLLDRSGMTRRCAVSARHTPPQTTVSNSRGESRRLVRGVKIAGIRAIRRGDPVMDQPLWRWDATAVAAAIRTRKISSREATQAVLGRLEAVNPKLNAVTGVLLRRRRHPAHARPHRRLQRDGLRGASGRHAAHVGPGPARPPRGRREARPRRHVDPRPARSVVGAGAARGPAGHPTNSRRPHRPPAPPG